MSPRIELVTPRLILVAVTLDLIEAEIADRSRLAHLLGAEVPADWPPPLNDENSMRWTRDHLAANPDNGGWGTWYFILRRDGDAPLLIGNGGFKGKFVAPGTCEVGYSVMESHQRRGYATEVVGGFQVASYDGITYNGQNERHLGACLFAYAVKEFQGDLYVAGSFDQICTENDVVPSRNIAKWSEPATAVGGSPAARKLRIEGAPNPFNPVVALSIDVPARSEVTVTIFDATGRVVRRLGASTRTPGPYRVTWNGAGDDGTRLASGVYFATVTAGKAAATTKLVLLK